MARAPSKRSGRTQPNARARERDQRVASTPTPAPRAPKKARTYEDDLFFMRLRRHQKWLFAVLALAFFLGFVVLGIGSGNGFLVDAFQNVGGQDSSIESVNDAQAKVDENPDDPDALLALANALQAAARPEEATGPLERYVELRPDDADTLSQLAALYEIQIAQIAGRAGQLQADNQGGSLLSTISLFPSASGFLGAAGQDPIANALDISVDAEVQEANEEVAKLRVREVPVYEALAELTPNEPLLQYQLGLAAFGAEEEDTAIAAFRKFLELAPDDPLAASAEGALAQLGVTSDSATG